MYIRLGNRFLRMKTQVFVIHQRQVSPSRAARAEARTPSAALLIASQPGGQCSAERIEEVLFLFKEKAMTSVDQCRLVDS